MNKTRFEMQRDERPPGGHWLVGWRVHEGERIALRSYVHDGAIESVVENTSKAMVRIDEALQRYVDDPPSPEHRAAVRADFERRMAEALKGER